MYCIFFPSCARRAGTADDTRVAGRQRLMSRCKALEACMQKPLSLQWGPPRSQLHGERVVAKSVVVHSVRSGRRCWAEASTRPPKGPDTQHNSSPQQEAERRGDGGRIYRVTVMVRALVFFEASQQPCRGGTASNAGETHDGHRYHWSSVNRACMHLCRPETRPSGELHNRCCAFSRSTTAPAAQHEGRALARYEAGAPLERVPRQREGGDELYARDPPKPACWPPCNGGPGKCFRGGNIPCSSYGNMLAWRAEDWDGPSFCLGPLPSRTAA